MAESTFNSNFKALYQDVLNYLGQDRDTTDADLLAKAKRRVNDAYRKFLALDWEFLSEFAKLEVENGKDKYELPDDFATIRTPFILVPNTELVNPAEVTIRQIWQLRSRYSRSGAPECFAFSATYSENVGIRYFVEFYPTPHTSLTYNYEYKKIPDILVNDSDIPHCPANLSHVLREFCLTEVEQFDEEGARVHTNNLLNVLLPQAIRENSIRTPNSVGSMNLGYSMELHPRFGNTISFPDGTSWSL